MQTFQLAGHLLDGVRGAEALIEVEGLAEVLDELRRVGLEGLGGGIHVDEHETGPGGHLGLGQAGQGIAPDLREVPLGGEVDEGALVVPGPAVERALERRRLAALDPQLRAPVQAAVVVRLDRPVVQAADQQRLVGDVVDRVVAGLGDVDLHATELPGARPEVLVLELGERRRRVAAAGHVGEALVVPLVVEERRRYRAGVAWRGAPGRWERCRRGRCRSVQRRWP